MRTSSEGAAGSRAERTDIGTTIDPLLAAQLSDCPRYDTWPGEMRLALAVVEDAIMTVRLTTGVATPRARRLARDASAWLASRDTTHPFAFENLCDYLGLSAAWIRSGLRRGGWSSAVPVEPARMPRLRGWHAGGADA
jgi:hypothetical protein